MKKRKMKIRNKFTLYNIKFLIILFLILLAFITAGYSLLNQPLEITGKSKIIGKKTTEPGNNEGINFKTEYEIKDEWFNNFKHYYNISVNLINNTEFNTTGWEVSMDIPSDVIDVQCWNASYTITGTRITFKNNSYNNVIPKNNKIEIGFIINTGINDNYIPTNTIMKIYSLEYPQGKEIVLKDGNEGDGSGSDPGGNEQPKPPYINVEIVPVNSWMDNNKYVTQFDVNISNISTNKVMSWEFDIERLNESELINFWNVNYVLTNEILHFSNLAYNGQINVNEQTKIGFILKSNKQNYIPTIKSKNAVIKK